MKTGDFVSEVDEIGMELRRWSALDRVVVSLGCTDRLAEALGRQGIAKIAETKQGALAIDKCLEHMKYGLGMAAGEIGDSSPAMQAARRVLGAVTLGLIGGHMMSRVGRAEMFLECIQQLAEKDFCATIRPRIDELIVDQRTRLAALLDILTNEGRPSVAETHRSRLAGLNLI